jgi:hypothetical protein
LFPQFCGNDFSYKKNAPKIPSRKIAGRISLAKKLSPKILPAILREGILSRKKRFPLQKFLPQNPFPQFCGKDFCSQKIQLGAQVVTDLRDRFLDKKCNELQKNGRNNVSSTFITAFRITQAHMDQPSGDGEMAEAVFGSNQTVGILQHSNYIIYLVSRVQCESLAYPLSNAPTLNKIGPELSQE